MRTVLDAGPLLSSMDRSANAHALAKELIRQAGPSAMVPDPVVVEVDQLARSRMSDAAARAFLDAVSREVIRRVPLDRALFDRAVEYDRAFADLGIGIVDATVMALAERERAAVLTFDFRDFRATKPLRGGFWRLAIDEESFRKILEAETFSKGPFAAAAR